MKLPAFIFCIGLLAAVGCSDPEPELPQAPAPAPAPDVSVAPTPTANSAAPVAGQPPAQAPSDVEPELKPVQMAIQSFESQNKRMPMNVDELLSSGAIQSLPKLPPGKMYFIDHGTKRIRVANVD